MSSTRTSRPSARARSGLRSSSPEPVAGVSAGIRVSSRAGKGRSAAQRAAEAEDQESRRAGAGRSGGVHVEPPEATGGRASRDAKSGIPPVLGYMWGNNFEEKTILGQKVLVDGYGRYDLGYMFLEDRVVLGSTTSVLRRALHTDVRGRLSETENFKLMMEESSGPPDWLMYANLRGIIEMATGVEGDCDMARCLTELRDYISEIVPFIAPLDMFSLTSSVNEKDRSFTVLLSVSSPESNPAVEPPVVVPQLFPSTSTP